VEKNNPKVLNAWCMYDWANSVYTLTITTAIFPVYFNAVTKQPGGSDLIPFLWMTKKSAVVYTYSLSIAFLLISFLSPLLSGIADYGGIKKKFMRFFVYLGSISCMGLYFFDGSHITLGILLFIGASIGYAGSLVFYNAFLPEIASPGHFDKLSAKGFSLGYTGSVILLIINLLVIEQAEWFGISRENFLPVRLSFLMAGLWWLLFSFYPLAYLPDDTSHRPIKKKIWLKGFHELKKVFLEIKKKTHLTGFLAAFFFYSMGFQTIMYLAGFFGAQELKLPEANLIATMLLIQLIAVGGASLFVFVAKKIGNVLTLLLAILICIFVCFAAYYITTDMQFYFIAGIIGIVMGGIQSMSRSTYSKLLPATSEHASYFSFYEFTEKTGIVVGTATYAIITDLTGSMRNSIFALILFFAAGMFFLIKLYKNRKSHISHHTVFSN
jgi:MFS transporter, UMF1 family